MRDEAKKQKVFLIFYLKVCNRTDYFVSLYPNNNIKPFDNEEITNNCGCLFDNIYICFSSGYYIWYNRCGDGRW